MKVCLSTLSSSSSNVPLQFLTTHNTLSLCFSQCFPESVDMNATLDLMLQVGNTFCMSFWLLRIYMKCEKYLTRHLSIVFINRGLMWVRGCHGRHVCQWGSLPTVRWPSPVAFSSTQYLVHDAGGWDEWLLQDISFQGRLNGALIVMNLSTTCLIIAYWLWWLWSLCSYILSKHFFFRLLYQPNPAHLVLCW